MSDGVIVRAGAHLADKDMVLFDRRTKLQTKVIWETKDKPFEQIRSAMYQAANTAATDFIIPECTPISNQGSIGSCVANGSCDALEILDGLDGTDKIEQLSRRFLYRIARMLTGDEHKDAGTYIRAAMQQLNKIGIFEEKYYPYSTKEEDHTSESTRPETALYMMAADNRIAGYYKLHNDGSFLNKLDLAIRANHPVVFGVQVNNEFAKYRGGGIVFGPPEDGSIGGHCMIVVGVRKTITGREWLWRNSWGSGWGDSGHVWVKDEYMKQAEDCWVGTRMRALI